MNYTVDIVPMGAVRMTGRGKFVKGNALRYLSYKTHIAYQLANQRAYDVPISRPIEIEAAFYLPIPKSDTKAKKALKNGAYCTVKPDIDNLAKGLYDSANGILWKDDNLIVKETITKHWSDNPRIELTVKEVSA